MPRPPGGELTAEASVPVAVRFPKTLYAQMVTQCGGKDKLAEFLRNCGRVGCSMPLDKGAGYQEGFMAGWADSKRKFKGGVDAA